jgi:drug/metabolite transporter (DMT)-like permease
MVGVSAGGNSCRGRVLSAAVGVRSKRLAPLHRRVGGGGDRGRSALAPSDPPFALGIGLVFVADIVWAGYTLRVGAPYPSAADAFYLSGIGFFVVGLLLVGGQELGKHAARLIDLLIVATGAAMLSWVLVLQPRFDPRYSLSLEPLFLVAYLLLYVVMLAIVARPLFLPARRVPTLYLICAALALMVISEAAYGSLASGGDYEAYTAGSPVYVGQLCFLTLLGTAALHPSMARLMEPAPAAPAEL